MATEVIQIGNISVEYISYQCPQGACCEVKMGNSYVTGATAEIQDIVLAYQDGSLTIQDQINATEDALAHFNSRMLQAQIVHNFWIEKAGLCAYRHARSFFTWSCQNHPETCNTKQRKLNERVSRAGKCYNKFKIAIEGMSQHLSILISELQRDVNTTAMETQVIQLQTQSETAIVNAEAGIMKVKKAEFTANLQKYVIPITLIILGIMFFRKK